MVDSSGGIVADPQRLKKIAGSVDLVVGLLDRSYQPRQGALAPAMGPWSAGAAAADATKSWGAFVGRLRGSVDGVAAGMRAAADGYTATDATNARSLEKAQ